MKTWFPSILCAACLPLLPCGCSEEPEPIRTYKVKKPADVYSANHVEKQKQPSESSPRLRKPRGNKPHQRDSRMLVAMLLEGSSAWFFKLIGPADQLDGAAETFARFIRSIEFSGGQPEWSLPDGWTQLPASDPRIMSSGLRRYATILVGSGDDAPELAVTRLGIPRGTGHDQYILINVNRWRKQMGLQPRKSMQNLYTDSSKPFGSLGGDETRKMRINNRTVVMVDYVGHYQPRRGSPPFMGR